MFTNTIDKKPIVVDKNNNKIVNLAKTIFAEAVHGLDSYKTVRMTDYFQMRPDKLAFNEYGTDEYTEYILKYSGISNPFSLKDDDILFIPDYAEANAQMAKEEEKKNVAADQVKTYYKFTNTDFKSDSTSYDNLANKVIPSGTPTDTPSDGFMVPYISDDGATAITIKNGRMYFGNDVGNIAQPSPADVEKYKESLATALDKKCATNGMSMTDFIRASIINK